MKLLLHWLLRDLRRHALLIALWALLVAVFISVRLWFRQRGLEYFPERDAVLIGSSLVLGLAEIFLLLRILLDDPAGGARTFWKTRPPSGGAVFAAKAVQIGLVSLAIPFAAEAVFLGIAGPSTDVTGRAVCLLLPPVLALMAGAAATNWRNAMAWLPAAFALAVGTFLAHRWLQQQLVFTRPVNWLITTIVMLLGSYLASWWLYRRRNGNGPIVSIALVVPAAAWLVAASAGFGDWGPRYRAPSGVNAAKLEAVLVGRAELPLGFGSLEPALVIKGLANTGVTHTYSRTVNLSVRMGNGPEAKVAAPNAGRAFDSWDLHPGGPVAWSLPPETRAALDTTAFTARGTVKIYCARQQTLRVAFDGSKHELCAGSARWRIQIPAPARPEFYARPSYYTERDAVGTWLELELIGDGGGVAWPPVSQENDTRLRHTATGETIRLVGIQTEPHAPLWQGAGYSRQRLVPKGIKREEAAAAYARIEQIAAEAGSNSPWVLEIDVLVPEGTLEVPFSLHWPEVK